eukprot:181358_1
MAANSVNRLGSEESPYLLQHAHNPVDWYPWGEEAFEAAKKNDRMIFLSIGYSTCHWCHVMEHESFEMDKTASVMNEHFISIKVDREERPDVDKVYMSFVQATTGGGGWPLSIFLTPDLKPVMGGTYFPPESKFGQPGFRDVLQRVASLWKSDRVGLEAQGSKIIEVLGQSNDSKSSSEAINSKFASSVLDTGYEMMAGKFDESMGGFGSAPKFPRPSELNFMFRISEINGEAKPGPSALRMAMFTLRKMADGGMHDHLGGGFHRYSVDEFWHVPHFEKMLYDNAQLAISYLEAYSITKDVFFKKVAEDIFEYIRRDMTHPDGGIFSAEAADSLPPGDATKKTEGAFYVWKHSEIKELLRDNADVFCKEFFVKPNGNCTLSHRSDPHRDFVGLNVLIRHKITEDQAADPGVLAECKAKLLAVRSERPRPSLDDKVITGWNGQMISAFAKGHQTLCVASDDEKDSGNFRYLEAAEKAAEFIRAKLFNEESGKLIRNYRKSASQTEAFVDDYAYLICGLLDLYEASCNEKWLEWAMTLQTTQDNLFWDSGSGGYFSTTSVDASILLRLKEDYDGAQPSPNSVAAGNLVRLGGILKDDGMIKRAEQTIGILRERLETIPFAIPQMCVALDDFAAPQKQIVIVHQGPLNDPEFMKIRKLVHSKPRPHTVLVYLTTEGGQDLVRQRCDAYKSMKPIDGKPTVYVCENFTCQKPASEWSEIESIL